jgi:DNA-binding FadR family transcriptional regulator
MAHFQDNIAEFARADLEFHLVLAKATGNPVLIKVNSVLRSILEVSMENIVSVLGMQDGMHYHRLIIEAVRARNAEAAENIMQDHIVRTIERLKATAEMAAPGTTPTSDQTKFKGDIAGCGKSNANPQPDPMGKPDH